MILEAVLVDFREWSPCVAAAPSLEPVGEGEKDCGAGELLNVSLHCGSAVMLVLPPLRLPP